MVKDIVRYPETPSLEYGIDVRKFDDELFALLEDLKDTIKANNLDGLAAYQIRNYYNVIVLRDGEEFLEFINPRIISQENKTVAEEETAYFPGKKAKVARFEKIKVVYQDRNGKDRSLDMEGKLARVMQRKVDYTFGGNFLLKMDKEERKRFEAGLSEGIESAIAQDCPTTFVRDKFLNAANILTLFMALAFVVSFFVDRELRSAIWLFEVYSFGGVVLFNIGYLLYGLYEGKKYKQCTSCQVGNFIGSMFISLARVSVLFLLIYLFL